MRITARTAMGVIAGVLLIAPAATAQVAPNTPPSSPSAVRELHRKQVKFGPPPAGLAPLSDISPAGVTAASHSFADWAHAERDKLTAYFAAREAWQRAGDPTQPAPPAPPIRGVLGYFMLLGDGPRVFTPGSIFAVSWVATTEGLQADLLVSVEGGCIEGAVPAINAYAPDHFVYLGAQWNDAWSDLGRTSSSGAGNALALVGNPVYAAQPTFKDIEKYYPRDAEKNEVTGQTSVLCQIRKNGALACDPIVETPEGAGFGEAAVQVAQGHIRLASALGDGTPSAGKCITLPIAFRISR